MKNLNAPLQKKPRFQQLSYELEDGTEVETQAVVIPGIIKSVFTSIREMNNLRRTEYRLAQSKH
jgi:hypothetical protein